MKRGGFPGDFGVDKGEELQIILATKRVFYWKKINGYIMMYILSLLVYVSPLAQLKSCREI